MALSVNEAIEKAKEIIAIDLQDAFKVSAAQALGSHVVQESSNTGSLIRNIRAIATSNGIEVSFPFYAQYLEYGTGIYGPKGEVIRPKTAKVLSWVSGGKRRYATHVKGMTPAPFIRPVIHTQFIPIVVRALNEAFSEVDLTK